jgi:hypothetical protein
MKKSTEPNEQPAKKVPDLLVHQILSEARVLSSMKSIVCKMQNDGVLATLADSIQLVFDNEIAFAFRELIRLLRGQDKTVVTGRVHSNLVIFKENLKTICLSISWLISREHLR